MISLFYSPLRTIFLLFLILFSSNSIAQKVKSKNLFFNLKNYPSRTMNFEKYSTYSLHFSNSLSRKEEVKHIKNNFEFAGLTEASKDKADFEISFRLAPMEIGDWEIVEKKDENGSKSYFYQVNYFAPFLYYFIPNPGRSYFEKHSALLDTMTLKVGSSFEKKLLESSYNKDELEKKVYEDYAKKVTKFFKDTYEAQTDRHRLDYFIAKGRKLDYDKHNDFYKTLKKDILDSEINFSLDGIDRKRINEQIEYIENELKSVELENEDARINKEVYHGFCFNLSLLYALINDFDKSWTNFNIVKDELTKYEIVDLHKFLVSYQTNYISSSKENIDFNNILKGKWEIEKVIRPKRAMGSDVIVSIEDILKQEEYSCLSKMTFEFDGTKIFQYNNVNLKTCTTEQNRMQWKVRSADESSIMQIGFGDVGYVDNYFTIIRINHEELIIEGFANLDPDSDTTSDVIYHFTKLN
jgi:hypothetical protein